MGDANYDNHQLSRENFRIDTFGNDTLSDVKIPLAKAGFHYTRIGSTVKCFACFFEFDASQLENTTDFLNYHKEQMPTCSFVQNVYPGANARPKKFLSYDSLRYEKERLETFIEWPVPWLLPGDLARDGFYYLRTNDHCACVFCRGIVGAWEVGDTPRGEHRRHFPHCPFIRGQPVGNVPLNHSAILDKLPLEGEEWPMPQPRADNTTDKSGASSSEPNTSSSSGRHMPGSYAECKGPVKKEEVNYEQIGLRQYSGPKRKDYVTTESRLKSFKRWPERVVQTPDQMAEAGFFYCGLSDHVRCFHCGNGLRNWELEDKPWEEHARWYPDCNYVLLSKGQEFIDKVRRERPPYLRSAASKDCKPQQVKASSGRFNPINEGDLEPLMESDIIKGVKDMGFNPDKIRLALRRKLEQTGLPFFSLEPCIEAVLQVMEEETQRELHGSSVTIQVEEEARNLQGEMMSAVRHHKGTDEFGTGLPSATTVSTSAPAVSSAPASTQEQQNPSESAPTSSPTVSSAPASSQEQQNPSESAPTSSLASSSGVSTGSSSISFEVLHVSPAESQPVSEAMEIEQEPEEAMEVQVPPSSSAALVPGNMQDLKQAEERMNEADKALKSVRSGPSSLEEPSEKEQTTPATKDQESSPKNDSVKTSLMFTGKDAAEELERIRESRTCKICMDGEMEVVFLPCSHMATCSKCAVTMAQCPICRDDIKYTIKPIIS